MLLLLALLAAAAIFATDRLYRTAQDRYVDEAFPLRYARARRRAPDAERGDRRSRLRGHRRPHQPPAVHGRPAGGSIATWTGLDEAHRPPAGDRGRRREPARLGAGARPVLHRPDRARRGRAQAGHATRQLDVLAGTAPLRRLPGPARTGCCARSDAILAGGRAQPAAHLLADARPRSSPSALAIVTIGAALLLYLPEHLKLLYDRERRARRSAERGDRASRALTHVATPSSSSIETRSCATGTRPPPRSSASPKRRRSTGPPCDVLPDLAGDRRGARRRRSRGRPRCVPGTRSGGSPPARRGSPRAGCSSSATPRRSTGWSAPAASFSRRRRTSCGRRSQPSTARRGRSGGPTAPTTRSWRHVCCS